MAAAFVGRDRELSTLEGHLASALQGKPRLCFVTGEAGAGKSTLLHAFLERAQALHPELVTAVGACNAQTGQSDPYLPFLGLLTQLTGDVQGQATSGENAHRLQSLMRFSVQALVDLAPDLIGTFVPGSSLLLNLGKYVATESGLMARVKSRLEEKAPETARELNQERICQQYTELLNSLALRCPLVLVIDDMQWIDSASIDLFFHLTRKLERGRILLVGCYRPNDVNLGRAGGRHPLDPVINELKRYHGDVGIDLESRSNEDRRAFVDAYLDAEPNRLGQGFREALCRHTGGNALFVTELLRNLQERGDLVKDGDEWIAGPSLDWRVLPSRVEGVIEERIGRLEEDLKEILMVASVEGESFTAQVVARVQQMKERELLRVLSAQLEKRHRLVLEGSTERVGPNWMSRFAFSHVLLQQYLYRDLGERERMLLHAEIGELIEELHGGETEGVAVQLARHFDLAGEPGKAIFYQLVAARRALGLSAYVEARTLLERALELLPALPAGQGRDCLELEIRNRRCTVLNAREGWDSPALIGEYYRARELCQALGERQQLSRILFGLWTYHLVKLDLERAHEIVQEYFELSADLQDSEALLLAHTAMGNTLFWLGRLPESMEHSRKALELFEPASQAEHVLQYGQDPRLFPLMFVAYGCCLLGDVEGGRATEREVLRLARELNHPFSQTIAFQILGYLAWNFRDAEAARRFADEEVRLAEAHEFPFYLGLALTLRGWADARLGRPAEGAADIRKGFGTWAAFGGRVNHSVYCLMLAEAEALAGRAGEALAVVAQGLEVARSCQELCYEAELLRLQGELSLAHGGPDAEDLFRQALEAARGRGAKLLELRAAVSLAGLWHGLGRGAEAWDLLDPVLSGFPPGIDAPDLLEARDLWQVLDLSKEAVS